MAYASWSVVFGEQPSAAKWNILGTNDASFNNGTGIGTNAIAAASLATSAIRLGYASITSNFTTTTGGSYVDVTGLSVTVTIPAGNRYIKVTGFAPTISSNQSAALGVDFQIYDTTGATEIGRSSYTTPVTTYSESANPIAIVQPSAGSRSYKMRFQQVGGVTGTIFATATAPAFILVEAI